MSKLSDLHLLRGRVLLRLIRHDYGNKLIHIPETFVEDERNPGGRASQLGSVGRGVVVAIGAPALSKDGTEVLPEFKVGDTVLFTGQHHSRGVEIGGEKLHAVAQEEIGCVLEEDDA